MSAHHARLVRTPDVRLIAPRRLVGGVALASTLAVAWWFVLGQATGPLPTPPAVVARSLAFLGDLIGASSSTAPAFTRLDHWSDVAVLVLDTLTMSVLAMGIAGLGTLGTVGPASRLLTSRDVAPEAESSAAW